MQGEEMGRGVKDRPPSLTHCPMCSTLSGLLERRQKMACSKVISVNHERDVRLLFQIHPSLPLCPKSGLHPLYSALGTFRVDSCVPIKCILQKYQEP